METPMWLMPAMTTSAGQLDATDLKYLHHYTTSVWPSMSFQQNDRIIFINRDWVPRSCVSSEHMLYSVLSISAMHLHDRSSRKRPEDETLALIYRQKALTSFNAQLANITADNYESLLITSMWMMIMVPSPTLPCTDGVCLSWVVSLFTMMGGLSALASLRWASGIEKLTIYPLFRRELKKLPPPPMLTPLPNWFFYPSGRQSAEWYYPNSPNDTFTETARPTSGSKGVSPSSTAGSTAQSAGVTIDTTRLPFRPQQLQAAARSPHAPASWKQKPPAYELPAPAFLPPPLLALLQHLVDPMCISKTPNPDLNLDTDPHRPILIPILHALSPIFLTLYYYRLSPDLYVRIFVLPTFFTPEFLALIRAHEPRALVLVGWYFAMLTLLPRSNRWFARDIIARVLQSVSNVVLRTGDAVLVDAMEGAYRIVRVEAVSGKEAAARTVFEKWEGVNWEEGPGREEEWRRGEEEEVRVALEEEEEHTEQGR